MGAGYPRLPADRITDAVLARMLYGIHRVIGHLDDVGHRGWGIETCQNADTERDRPFMLLHLVE